jgi:phage gp29-like protein
MIKEAFKALHAALNKQSAPVDKITLGNAVVALQQPSRTDRQLNPQSIGQALKAADQGNFAELMGLAILLEDRDTQWRTVLQSRKLAVIQLPISVEAAADDDRHQKDAELAREILGQSGVRRLVFDLLDGVSKGFSVAETEWTTGAKRWLPSRFVYRDPRLFRTKPDDPDQILWTPNAADKLGLNPDDPLQRGKFIVHKPMLTSAPAPQAGLCRLGIWLWMFKSFGIRDWAEFLENYGQPLRVGKYPASATPDEKAILKRAVVELGRAAGVTIPIGMELAFEGIGDGKASPDLHLKLVSYFDQQASKLILGQTTTTDAIGGGHAVSKEHNEVRGDIRDADAADLAETLERDLIRVAIDLNHGPPPDGLYPQVKLAEPETADIAALTTALKELVPLGLLVEQSVVRDRIGLPDPPEGIGPELLLRAPSPSGPASVDPVPPKRGTPATQTAQALLSLFSQAVQPSPSASQDGIDHLAAEALADWEEQMQPLIGPLEAFLREATSLEDARDRLAEAIQAMDVTKLGNALAQSQFFARCAGELGILTDPRQATEE